MFCTIFNFQTRSSNDESLLGQDTAGNQVVQAMKEHTDSQHIFHLKK